MRAKQILAAFLILLAGLSRMLAGTISGKVTYTGTPAQQRPIDMSGEPACARQHATPVTNETVVTGPDHAWENVVVYVSSGAPMTVRFRAGGHFRAERLPVSSAHCGHAHEPGT